MDGTARRGHAETSAVALDTGLRGLTCAVPFEDVWQASLRLAGGELNGWTVASADDHDGVIHAFSRSLFGQEHDIVIRVSLDEDAQTRIDAVAVARKPGTDFGASERRLRRFFRALDQAIAPAPGPRLAAPEIR